MLKFLNEDFLLTTRTARQLYHQYAASARIIDYHCHINPKDIAEDKKYANITDLWLKSDHYKWRLMREAGVAEHFITGSASDYEKFNKYAYTLSRAVGNPLYHWSHLELWRYFNIDFCLTPETAKHVWEICNDSIAALSAKCIIQMSNVDLLCTTDDPADNLHNHSKIAIDPDITAVVLPTFRPDKALCIESADFLDYIAHLSDISGVSINSYTELCEALTQRMDFFAGLGCLVSDHGLTSFPYAPAPSTELEKIFQARKDGAVPFADEQKFKTALMLFLGAQYAKRGWTMQLHFGCKRNVNSKMYTNFGNDAGFDCIIGCSPLNELTDYLNALACKEMPKTILYSLNPLDNAPLSVISSCFNSNGKVRHGAAWWFNDHYRGIYDHLETLSSLGYLPGFIGMLTDSRCLLSYTRHEYFRRILCEFLGKLTEHGLFPADLDLLGSIVSDISYKNAKDYFEFLL